MGKTYEKIIGEKRILVWEKTNGYCWYCGVKFSNISHMEIEHMRNLGGDNISNLYPSCKICNARKGRMTLEEFRKNLSQPKFNGIQIEYLERLGIKLPKNPQRIIFYGETLE